MSQDTSLGLRGGFHLKRSAVRMMQRKMSGQGDGRYEAGRKSSWTGKLPATPTMYSTASQPGTRGSRALSFVFMSSLDVYGTTTMLLPSVKKRIHPKPPMMAWLKKTLIEAMTKSSRVRDMNAGIKAIHAPRARGRTLKKTGPTIMTMMSCHQVNTKYMGISFEVLIVSVVNAGVEKNLKKRGGVA
jgi:hypothetical protein